MAWLVSICIVILTYSSVCAQGQMGAVPWVGASARYGTYRMSDVNVDMGNVDMLLVADFKEIRDGTGFGNAEVGIEWPSGLSIGLRYERILASSEVTDQTGSLKYDLGAHAICGAVEYLVPSSWGPSVGGGAGIGIVSSAGFVRLTINELGTISGGLNGWGPLGQVYALCDLLPGSQFSVLTFVGYRYAKANSLKVNDVKVRTEEGEDYDADYTGPILGASLRLRLAPPNRAKME